jgi:hypothetical protein
VAETAPATRPAATAVLVVEAAPTLAIPAGVARQTAVTQRMAAEVAVAVGAPVREEVEMEMAMEREMEKAMAIPRSRLKVETGALLVMMGSLVTVLGMDLMGLASRRIRIRREIPSRRRRARLQERQTRVVMAHR